MGGRSQTVGKNWWSRHCGVKTTMAGKPKLKEFVYTNIDYLSEWQSCPKKLLRTLTSGWLIKAGDNWTVSPLHDKSCAETIVELWIKSVTWNHYNYVDNGNFISSCKHYRRMCLFPGRSSRSSGQCYHQPYTFPTEIPNRQGTAGSVLSRMIEGIVVDVPD